MPELSTIFVETFEPTHPFGVKAVAEIPMDGVAPAVGNAIYDAIGRNIDCIPITPEKVWTALHARALARMAASIEQAPTRKSVWVVAAILFLASAYFYQDPEWNGNSRLDLTRAIVERGTLQIDNYHDDPEWLTGDKALYNGHYYSDKAIGSSLLAVPLYFLLHGLATGLGLCAEQHYD